MFQLYLMYSILLKSVVHGHGQGKRLDTYFVLEPRASCVVSLQHVPMFQYARCALHGHGRGKRLGTCIMLELRVHRVS